MNEQDLRIKAAEAQGWSGPWRFGNENLHGTPPSGQRQCRDGDHVPEEVDRIIKGLCRKVDVLTEGIRAVRTLIDESQGVAGLHLNGDIAPWDELEEDGRYGDWLAAFADAERVLE